MQIIQLLGVLLLSNILLHQPNQPNQPNCCAELCAVLCCVPCHAMPFHKGSPGLLQTHAHSLPACMTQPPGLQAFIKQEAYLFTELLQCCCIIIPAISEHNACAGSIWSLCCDKHNLVLVVSSTH